MMRCAELIIIEPASLSGGRGRGDYNSTACTSNELAVGFRLPSPKVLKDSENSPLLNDARIHNSYESEFRMLGEGAYIVNGRRRCSIRL
jgi:hypothetical protein